MIQYTSDINLITEEMLQGGFFAGWPNPPSAAAHLRILHGAYVAWVAVDTTTSKVVGFINAVSDGVLSAYIPLLEVLPEYQKQGIGKELVSRMLESLKGLYMVDLLCDEDMQGYYAKLGMYKTTGMCARNFDRQNCM
ncbi:MAG: GNAT family N-acetyltransferase [Firmicutes bacterium]|nr:GNAT family N-acetyltransferase [Bacillota bacterium]